MTTAQASGTEPVQPSTARKRVSADELAAEVIIHLHRLAKQATLYEDDDDNETQVRQLQATADAVKTYGSRTGRNVSLFWMEQSVFVGRRLLRAGRATYSAALELAAIVAPLGISQIVVGFDVPLDEIRQLQGVFRHLQRNMKPSVEQLSFTRVRLRRAPDLGKRFVDDRDLSPREQALRCYAKSVVVMRRFIEDLQGGDTTLPIRVRRISQQLTDMTASNASALLSVAVLHNARADHASQAVNSAVVALMMGRHLGGDARSLSRIAMAALLYDVGRPRVAGVSSEGDIRHGTAMPRLGEEQYAELPAATAAVMTQLGGVNESSMMQTAMAYEALHLRHADELGAPYGGLRKSTSHGRLLAMARHFATLNADPDVDPPRSVAETVALLQLDAAADGDLGVFRLLASVLQIYPTGAMVELSDGAIAQVVDTPSDPAKFSLPLVRVVIDSQGQRLARPQNLYLSTQSSGGERDVGIARVLALPDEDQLEDALEGYRRAREQPQAAASASWLPPSSAPDQTQPSREASPAPSTAVSAVEPAEPEDSTAIFQRQQAGVLLRPFAGPMPGSASPDGTSLPVPPAPPRDAVSDITDESVATIPPAPPDPAALPDITDESVATIPPQAPDPAVRELTELDAQPFAPELDLDEPEALPAEDRQGDSWSASPPQPTAEESLELDGDEEAPGEDRVVQWDAQPPRPPSAPAVATPGILPPAAEIETGAEAVTSTPEPVADSASPAPAAVADSASPAPAAVADSAPPAPEADADAVPATPEADPATPEADPATPEADPARPEADPAPSVPQTAPPVIEAIPEAIPAAAVVEPTTTPAPSAPTRPAEPAAERQRVAIPAAAPVDEQGEPVEPRAQGVLSKTPLLHLVVYVAERNLSGSLVLDGPQGDRFVLYLQDGNPCKIFSSGMVAPLDRVLLEAGLADYEQLQRTLLHISKTGELHGEHLIAKGIIDRPQLLDALGRQLLQKAGAMFKLPPESSFAFYDKVNLLESYGGPELTSCHSMRVVMAGIRSMGKDPKVDETLARLGNRSFRVHPMADTSNLGLTQFEQDVVTVLAEDYQTYDELRAAAGLQEGIAKLMVYALLVTRSLEYGDQEGPASSHQSLFPTKPSAPPSPRPVSAPASRDPRSGVMTSKRLSRVFARPATISRAPSASPPSVGSRKPSSQPQPAPSSPSSRPRPAPSRPSSPSSQPEPTSSPPSSQPQAPPASPRPPLRPAARSARPPGTAAVTHPPGVVFGRPSGHQSAPKRPPTASPTEDGASPAAPSPEPTPSEPATGRSQKPPAEARAPLRPAARPPSPATTASSPPVATSARPPSGAAANGAPRGVPKPSADKPAAAPPKTEPSGDQLSTEEIEERLGTLDSQNYFEMLGLTPKASDGEIQQAYVAAARRWHPDRLAREQKELTPQVSKIFARMNEAFRTLSKPQKRQEYELKLAAGGGTAEEEAKVSALVDAAMSCEKAQVMLKKGALEEAEELARQAYEADRDQPEYATTLAWVRAQRLGPPPANDERAAAIHYSAQLQMLNMVLKAHPSLEQALYYRAMLLKQSGSVDEAYRDFKKVAGINPKNLDAAREVRLYEMRNPSKRKQKKSGWGGFFGS